MMKSSGMDSCSTFSCLTNCSCGEKNSIVSKRCIMKSTPHKLPGRALS